MSQEDPCCARDWVDFMTGERWRALAHWGNGAVAVRLVGDYFYFDLADARGFAEAILRAVAEGEKAEVSA